MSVAIFQNIGNVPHKVLPITQGTIFGWHHNDLSYYGLERASGKLPLWADPEGCDSWDPQTSSLFP